MFYKKKGLPEIGEVVMCTVKSVLPHSVFVVLDEYGSEAMLHISEIAPGRIRNIRDYVKEDKKIICKVLKIDLEKRHVDISLRRVNQAQKRNKNEQYKNEQRAEKLLESVGAKLKLNLDQMYKQAGEKIIQEYGNLSDCFYALVEGEIDLIKDIGIEPKLAKELTEMVKDKIKPVEVTVSGIISASNVLPDGMDKIKKVLLEMGKHKKYDAKITYIGAPRYMMSVTAGDYKTVEARINEIVSFGIEEMKKLGGDMKFEKNKN